MAGGEIQFPKPIIQRLQSFLTGKQAARTTLVSKSWHSAWLTRPNLDFDDTHFGRYDFRGRADEFWSYAKKTIKRYEKSGLKIESFKLCMQTSNCYGRADLANKLIVKALRIGATRLCIQLDKSFVLPHEVFAADNLVGLSVSGCRINLDDGVVVKCRRLQSLILDDRADIPIDTLFNIVSSCPSIEKLSLLPDDDYNYEMGCSRLGKDKRGRRAAAAAMVVDLVDNQLHRLRCLVLSYVSFKTLRLGDLLSRFPFLKDFTLYLNLHGFSIFEKDFEKEIQISNCSIERVKLGLEDIGRCTDEERRRRRRPRVKFDVPSVRNFTFEGDIIPRLSFMSTPSREWESHVSINCGEHHGFTTFWFDELSEFLTKLSQSKTHLSLHVRNGNETSFDYKVGDDIIQGLRRHELENLTIDMTDLPSLSSYALLDGLFRLCRPKLINPYYEDDPDKQRYNHPYNNNIRKPNIDFLCQRLEQGINVKVSSPTQFMYGLNDLEEVNAQAFNVDDVPAEWRPIPLESLLDADADSDSESDAPHEHVQGQQRVRLLLKWKPS